LLGPAQLNGVELPAGDYQVKWEGDASEVQVAFTRGNKTIATAKGKVMELDNKTSLSEIVWKNDGNGTRTIAQIRPAGKKFALVLTGNGERSGE
jgi:hypothetical protein